MPEIRTAQLWDLGLKSNSENIHILQITTMFYIHLLRKYESFIKNMIGRKNCFQPKMTLLKIPVLKTQNFSMGALHINVLLRPTPK